MRARRAVHLSALAAAAISATLQAQQPSVAEVVQQIGRYAAAYQSQLADIVAEERYVQDVSYRNLPNRFAAPTTHRELRSDLLLVRATGSAGYTEFRDVFEVDGRAVRDRQDRLARLFLASGTSADTQIAQIHLESSRYNIGNVERTVNTPTLALNVVLPATQPRFRFARTGKTTPGLLSSGKAAADTVIEFDEVQRPTVIKTSGGRDLPLHGRVWIEPASGRVSMTELVAEDFALRATIDVGYRWDPRLQLMVPAEMRERYDVRHDGAVILGSATYSNVRQFRVRTEERLSAEPPSVEPPITPAIAPSNPETGRLPVLNADQQMPGLIQPPTFQSATELVLVDFVVTDKKGRAVGGLTAKDFLVREDGKQQAIASFEAFGGGSASTTQVPTTPERTVANGSTAVLVDDVHLTPDQAARLHPALKGLLTTVGTRAGTLVLVSPASNVSLAIASTSGRELSSAVDRIIGRRVEEHTDFPIADSEALAIARRDLPAIARVATRFRALNPELNQDQAETLAIEQASQVAHDARDRRDRMYDVILSSLDWLSTQPGRHGLIVVSGGFAADPDDTKYNEVVTRSLRANAPIDVLDARGLSGFDRYHDVEFSPLPGRNADDGPFGRFEAAEATTGLAIDTGGIVVANRNDMTAGLDQLLESMTTYYVVAYRPPEHSKAGYRRIKVEVRVKGLYVRARTGYSSP
jgi:VWFA-related protein